MGQKPALAPRVSTRTTLSATILQRVALLGQGPEEVERGLEAFAEANPFVNLRRRQQQSFAAFEDTLAAPERGWQDQLSAEVAGLNAPEEERSLALALVPTLSDTGYFDADPVEEAARLGATTEEIDQALSLIQRCEPAGVGARDLMECLLLQLVDRGFSRDMAFSALARLEQILAAPSADTAQELRVSEATAKDLYSTLRAMRPHPVEEAPTAEPQTLAPDAEVVLDALGVPQVKLIDSPEGRLELDVRLIEQALQTVSARDYARKRAAEARALIAAITFRSTTVIRVIEAVVKAQPEFFRPEPGPMRPLTRADVALDLSLHASTVGRAVAHKALQFEGRVYALKHFFSKALPLAGGEDISARHVEQKILKLIQRETTDQVLSDGAIQEQLLREGVDIARRTVAKYRQCLNIPSSSKRRRLLSSARGPG